MPNKLYWYTNRFTPDVPRYSETQNSQDDDSDETKYVVINVDQTLAYVGYNQDFGPLNLSQVHKYCT
jgi:Dual specificity protein phosphatase, N-terminal half